MLHILLSIEVTTFRVQNTTVVLRSLPFALRVQFGVLYATMCWEYHFHAAGVVGVEDTVEGLMLRVLSLTKYGVENKTSECLWVQKVVYAILMSYPQDTINPLQLFLFTNVTRCSRLPFWVAYFIYLKLTHVSSIVYQSLYL